MTNKATALEWRTLFNSNLQSVFFELLIIKVAYLLLEVSSFFFIN